ncbi:MAG: phosphocholine cytidylyltransferase family protein [Proteobacteria bacterium]|nr:phosphocholine cytidylyltransferase family protein [Pseudomonadota bacterium]
MKAVILAAGQGSRLHPYTENCPKALIKINKLTLLEWQLWHFIKNGINEFIIVVGFKADDFEKVLENFKKQHPFIRYELIYNHYYLQSENILSCYLALNHYQKECIVVNGDVLFPISFVKELITKATEDIHLLYSAKSQYDDDDMKISKQGPFLKSVDKNMPTQFIEGESIGMLFLSVKGAKCLHDEIEHMLKNGQNQQNWYLKAIDNLAGQMPIHLIPAPEQNWCEIDYPNDLLDGEKLTKKWLTESTIKLISELEEIKEDSLY